MTSRERFLKVLEGEMSDTDRNQCKYHGFLTKEKEITSYRMEVES